MENKMPEVVVDVEHLSKEYKLYDSEMDRLKEAFHPLKKSFHRSFFALKDLSFQIRKGEKVGIIGSNGAGKSTLLKILTEVLNQTSGEMHIYGRVAALLELGAGFNVNYTGRENIKLNCSLMGIKPEEYENLAKKIIDFADIGDFIDQPVKNYSSGMFVRLAFATQIFSEPDILIVDEALSVGDIRFQQKCYRAMDRLMKDKTVILVTHDTAAVTRFCQRVLWINHGELSYDGEVTEGLKAYQEYLLQTISEEKKKTGERDFEEHEEKPEEELSERSIGLNIPNVAPDVHYKGNGEAQIYQCGLYNEEYELIDVVEPGETVKCISRISYDKEVYHPILGLAIRDRLGNEVIGINTKVLGAHLPTARNRQEYEITFQLPQLNKGEYTVTIAIANGYQEDHVQLCWLDDALIFQVKPRKYDIPGLLYIDRGKVNVYNISEKEGMK